MGGTPSSPPPPTCDTSCSAGSYGCSCSPCPVGYYCSDGINSVACAVGTYQPSTSQTSCLSSPAGSYVNSTGMSYYYSASPGYYCPNTTLSAQTPCPSGYYSSASGASICSACPYGHYSLAAAAGTSACSICPSGMTSHRRRTHIQFIIQPSLPTLSL
jgi:hypothetical protein